MATTKKKRPAKAPKPVKTAKAAPAAPAAAPKKGGKAWAVVLMVLLLLGALVVQTVVMAKRKAAMTWDMVRIGNIVPKGLSDGQGMGAISLRGDKADNLYFLEGLGNDLPRLQKFDPTGRFLARYAPSKPQELINIPRGLHVNADGSCAVVLSSGSVKLLDADLKFKGSFETACQASGIGQDGQGNWVVSCVQDNKILVLDPKGKRLAEFGVPGTNTGDVATPTRLATSKDGEIIVLETISTGPRVKVFSPEHAFLRQFNVPEVNWNEATGMGVNADGLLFFNDQVGDKAVVVYDFRKGKYRGNTKGTKDNQLFFSPGAIGANAWGQSVYVGTVVGTIKSRMPLPEEK